MSEDYQKEFVKVIEDGVEKEYEVLFCFNDEKTKKDFVVFFLDDQYVSARKYIPTADGGFGETFEIETEEEYNLVNEMLDAFIQDCTDGCCDEDCSCCEHHCDCEDDCEEECNDEECHCHCEEDK